MKKLFIYLIPSAIFFLFAGCAENLQNEEPIEGPITRRYELSFDVPTKTALWQDNKHVSFVQNDKIFYYTKQAQLNRTAVRVDNGIGYIDLTLSKPYDYFLNAFYSGASDTAATDPVYNITSGQGASQYSFCVENVAPEHQSFRSFADVHACVAHQADLTQDRITFRNIVSIFKFTLDDASVKKIVFSSPDASAVINGGRYGLLQVTLNAEGELSSVTPYPDFNYGTNSITINTTAGEGDYYFAIIPSFFPNGFVLSSYNSTSDNAQPTRVIEYNNPIVAGINADGDFHPSIINLGLHSAWKSKELIYPVRNLTVTPASLNFITGDDSQTLTATVTGDEQAVKTVSWNLADGGHSVVNVETLSVSGDVTTLKVTPVAVGSTTITFTTDGKDADGNHITKTVSISVREPDPSGGGTESGLYLGIIGFNDELYKMDIERLDATSKSSFDSFINSLTTKNGTLLYYSVDQALRTLQRAQYPDDLYNVSLVTFTDGLDMGSPMMMDNYTTDEECLQNLNNRLSVSTVSGVPITAYSVGLRGNDVNTSQQVEMFRKNLKKLACPESNAYEESNMSAVNARFQDIADKISQTTSTTKYILELTIPGKATGTVWRFTLDGASSATYSSMYIEGTFNLSTKALTNVTYHGMTCSSGSTVQGQVNGIHITYSFSDIIPDGTSTISKDKVWTWWYAQSSSNFWQGNTEFDKDEDVKITVSRTKRSAVVLLDLDCSKSLDNQFYSLKNYAKNFVATLYNASFDPYAVTGITLDKSTMILDVGDSFTLTATISPSTAAEKSVQWSSTNPSVAKVESNGKVTGVKAGTATIYATTVDGGFTASCEVYVLGTTVPVTSVTLDVTTKYLENIGDEFTINATVLPDNASNKAINWTLEPANSNVVEVTSSGKVTAKSLGTVTVVASSVADPTKFAKCVVTVGNPAEGGGVDLSANGTANCYIVNQNSGKYRFNATVQGNSTDHVVGKLSDAIVLWESRGKTPTVTSISSGTVVSGVRLSDDKNYVLFEAKGYGSALIAVSDASNTILWSWHIWVWEDNYNDATCFHTYKNGAGFMMDRDLGADANFPKTDSAQDKSAYGLLYQWGRKDPFFGSDKRVDTGNIPYPQASNMVVGTVEYATAHPNVYITIDTGTTHRDWIYGDARYNTLWGTYKTKYDPCPPGWKVPSHTVWSTALGYSLNHVYTTAKNERMGLNFAGVLADASSVFYQASGSMGGTIETSYFGIDIGGATQYGDWWSCGVNGNNGRMFSIVRNAKEANPGVSKPRSNACNVRCIKEIY